MLYVTDLGPLHYNNEDKGITPGIARSARYENSEFEKALIDQNLKQDDYFVDVGAHVGYFSVFAAQRHARVLALEPNEDNYKNLCKNSSIYKHIATKRTAVSNYEGAGFLFLSGDHNGDHKLYPVDGRFIERVDVMRLDSLLRKPKVDFIKIDVQGHEHRVVQGAERIICTDRPNIILEYSPYHIIEMGADPNTVLDYYFSLPYDNIVFDKDPATVESPDYATIFFTR